MCEIYDIVLRRPGLRVYEIYEGFDYFNGDPIFWGMVKGFRVLSIPTTIIIFRISPGSAYTLGHVHCLFSLRILLWDGIHIQV